MPGDLLVFKLEIALLISSFVIGEISLSLASLPSVGRSKEFRNSAAEWLLTCSD